MRFSGKTVATAAATAANTTANTTTTSCTGALRGKKKKEEEEKEERKKGINKYEWPLAGQQRNRKKEKVRVLDTALEHTFFYQSD